METRGIRSLAMVAAVGMALFSISNRSGAQDDPSGGGLSLPEERPEVRKEVLSLPFKENIWTVPLPLKVKVKRATFSGEHLFIETEQNELIAVNRFTGMMAWRFSPDTRKGLDYPPVVVPGVAEEVIYYEKVRDRKPIELEMELKQKPPEDETEKKIWEKKIAGLKATIAGAKKQLQYLPDIDNVFCVSDGYLYCIERRSKFEMWSRKLPFTQSAALCASPSYLFVPTYELDRVYALDVLQKGEPITYYKALSNDTTVCDIGCRPVFSPPNNLYFASINGFIYCFDTAGRKLNWAYKTGGPIRADPTVYEHYYPAEIKQSADGSTTKIPVPMGVDLPYAAHPLEIVIAREENDALLERWLEKEKMKGRNIDRGRKIFLFVGSYDYSFYAMDANEGKVEWKYQIGGAIKTPAYAKGDTVYVKTEEGSLFAFDVRPMFKNAKGEVIGERRNGVLRWKLPMGERFLVKGKKNVYVLGPNNEIYAMDEMSGEIRGRYKIDRLKFLLSNTIDDVFYAITEDGCIYALREPRE